MSVIGTVKAMLQASSAPSTPGGGTQRSKGAYWCHDCEERILDLDVEGDGPPSCPECGDEMTFERSVDSAGCAC